MAKGRKTKARRSVRLEDFSARELAALAAYYPTIRRELAKRDSLIDVRLPAARSRAERLAALRKLEAAGELWIRISYAGNLNVWAREGRELRGERDDDESVGYLTVLRLPFTSWCVPRGRYIP